MANWRSGKLKWIITGITAVSGFGASLVYIEIEKLGHQFSPTLSVLNQEKQQPFVYIRREEHGMINQRGLDNKGFRHIVATFEDHVIGHIPSSIAKYLPESFLAHQKLLSQRYVSPWKLLRTVSSPNQELSHDIVTQISNHRWLDYEYRLLGKNLDPSFIFALARTKGVDERFFLPPKPPALEDSDIEFKLYDMLTKLPQDTVDSCLRFFTQDALSISDERQWKKGGRWCFGGNGLNYAREIVPQEKVESFCLQALVKHSKISSHCDTMVNLGVLELLKKIHLIRPDSHKIQRNILRILSNICVNEKLHSFVLASGWVSYLVKMSNSKSLPYRIQASRALANLDKKFSNCKYLDGIYEIYPRYRTENAPSVDIVLIHGLLGGAFHTWRQQKTDLTDNRDYTSCWPETWLPEDLPNVRVISVEYDTHLSDWLPHCPHEKQTQTISFRSKEILEKLKMAGIGQERPVVWLAHSMGGLVLKKMLVIAKDKSHDYQRLVNNSRGIIFYSTPHSGSQLAEYSRKVRKLLFPSVEVMALSHDSPQLLRLNNEFRELCEESGIEVLSFGEKQSTNVGLGKINIHIVPPESADPGFGSLILCDSNHLNVCKPVSRRCPVYRQTVDFVKFCLSYNEHVISTRIDGDPREPPDFLN